jgi:tRNA pseudouridine38-40 synthase
MRHKLLIAYDGTHYAGWQVQANADAIQPRIQKALEIVLRQKVDLTGSGRTDAGVHASGQTAHFDALGILDLKKTLLSLNALLPLDIRILEIEPTEPDFHARYSAKSKVYHYHLARVADPFTKLYRHLVLGPFNTTLLKEGALQFIGTHDFTSFANTTAKEKPGVRTIYRLDVVEERGGVRLEFEGNGFLYKMVRNITGTLLEVAAGKIPPEEIGAILKERKRCKAKAAAPAKGLFLHQVKYTF